MLKLHRDRDSIDVVCDQVGSPTSTNELARICWKIIKVKDEKDRYKRYLGICYKGNSDINAWLVKNGYAIAYTRYSKKYVLDEQYAKENKLGIWRGAFVEPEKWRRIMN